MSDLYAVVDLYAIDAAAMRQVRLALGRLHTADALSDSERRSYAMKLDTLFRQSVQLKYSDIKKWPHECPVVGTKPHLRKLGGLWWIMRGPAWIGHDLHGKTPSAAYTAWASGRAKWLAA